MHLGVAAKVEELVGRSKPEMLHWDTKVVNMLQVGHQGVVASYHGACSSILSRVVVEVRCGSVDVGAGAVVMDHEGSVAGGSGLFGW